MLAHKTHSLAVTPRVLSETLPGTTSQGPNTNEGEVMTERNDGSYRVGRPTRRGVLTASAWAVPVIAVAAATPAAAASATSGFVVNGFDAYRATAPGADFLVDASINTADGDPIPAGTTVAVYVNGTQVLYTVANQDAYAVLPLDYADFTPDAEFYLVLNINGDHPWTSQTYETNTILAML